MTSPGPTVTKRTLINYSHTVERVHEVLTPRTERELLAIFARARAAGTRVVFRGGGMSFDSQSMGADLVVSMEGYAELVVDEQQETMTVGTGITWGEILRRLAPTGLLPGVVVSSSHATPGGTLSNHAHQRFSPTMGKEGDWIVSLRMVTPAGQALTCSRDENAHLFFAAIGGLGWLGAVTSVTYRLQRWPVRDWAETSTSIVEGAAAIAERLEPGSPSLAADGGWLGAYAPLVFSPGRVRALVCRSRMPPLGAPKSRKRMILFSPWSPQRIPFEIAVAVAPWGARLIWWLAFHFYYRVWTRFADPLLDYTFFMDGHSQTRDILAKVGVDMRALQQAYVIPTAAFARFLDEAQGIWSARGETPTMVDVIHANREKDPFLLSPSHEMDGLVITVTYDSLSRGRIDRAGAILGALSAVCRRLGGRVQLTKNVFCSPEDLEAMYGPRLDEFFALKERIDPGFVLRNDFLERLFPARIPSVAARVEPSSATPPARASAA